MTTRFRQGSQDRPPHMTLPGPNAAPSQDEPLPDAMFQSRHFTRTMEIVQTYFLEQESTLVSGDTPVYFRDSEDNQRFFKPDCYVAFNVDQVAIRERNGYFIDEVGKAPDFALEIASETTADNDTGFKRFLYALLGIKEYWRFDSTGGALYGEALVGERLVDGVYQPIPLHETPDGIIWGHSPLLGLDLCWERERLRFHNPSTLEYLRDLPEAEAEIIELQDELTRAEERVQNERIARRAAEEAAQNEQAAREAAEARVQALLDEIRRLSRENDPPQQPS